MFSNIELSLHSCNMLCLVLEFNFFKLTLVFNLLGFMYNSDTVLHPYSLVRFYSFCPSLSSSGLGKKVMVALQIALGSFPSFAMVRNVLNNIRIICSLQVRYNSAVKPSGPGTYFRE